MNLIIADTGALYAMADGDDAWHEKMINYISNNKRVMLLVSSSVMVETVYLINKYLGVNAEQKFVQSIVDGELKYENILIQDLKRSNELIKQYTDINIGFVDASTISIAERLNINHILTTDRRHFSTIKPKKISSLVLLP
ncbi:PIN domain-containing protein [Candidatus Desantisbacteria bacterium]|nr:PIN domain-containing protein [Candidatus Desantisbacteria bacterium]